MASGTWSSGLGAGFFDDRPLRLGPKCLLSIKRSWPRPFSSTNSRLDAGVLHKGQLLLVLVVFKKPNMHLLCQKVFYLQYRCPHLNKAGSVRISRLAQIMLPYGACEIGLYVL